MCPALQVAESSVTQILGYTSKACEIQMPAVNEKEAHGLAHYTTPARGASPSVLWNATLVRHRKIRKTLKDPQKASRFYKGISVRMLIL